MIFDPNYFFITLLCVHLPSAKMNVAEYLRAVKIGDNVELIVGKEVKY